MKNSKVMLYFYNIYLFKALIRGELFTSLLSHFLYVCFRSSEIIYASYHENPLFTTWSHRLEQVHLKDLPRNAQVSNFQQFPAGDKIWSPGTFFELNHKKVQDILIF